MASPERLAAISVDLDEIPCYTAIHGLEPPRGDAAHAIYDRALPRLAALFARERVPCTFFAIGRDLDRRENGAQLRALAAAGHEIGCHSLSHLYDLTRRDGATLRAEIRGGLDAIEAATGARPRGFRAPGYTINDEVFDALEELGVRWDSSVFPCPTYYAAKGLALAAIALRGRRSRSVLDDPRVLAAPADPYHVGRPYYRRGAGLLELPIGVTRDATGRLPFIGTTVVLAGERGARALAALASGRPLVNLELHGIDLADAAGDGLEALAPHQPDLRRSVAEKERALRAAIGALRERGYTLVTLSEAARRLG